MPTQSPQLAHERLAAQFDSLMNPYDLERRLDVLIGDYLRDVRLEGLSVLDAGCGTGHGTLALAERGANVVAVDLGRDLLLNTTRRVRCQPVLSDITQLPFANNTFDVVFSSEVIEHTPNPLATVMELDRVLKPGGHLVLSTPCKLWQLPVRIASALRLRPYDGLENFVQPRHLRTMLERQGTHILDHRGIHLLPFQITPLHPFLRLMDRFGRALLPIMINQCIHGTKS
jgi:2-polyprenyl-3-methyl-5-hydroxy-6-metoxy-1,4-benzoquinol methylase